jgi:hypothetical protein
MNTSTGSIYSGVCAPLAALFSWQQATRRAAVMEHWYFTQKLWEFINV